MVKKSKPKCDICGIKTDDLNQVEIPSSYNNGILDEYLLCDECNNVLNKKKHFCQHLNHITQDTGLVIRPTDDTAILFLLDDGNPDNSELVPRYEYFPVIYNKGLVIESRIMGYLPNKQIIVE